MADEDPNLKSTDVAPTQHHRSKPTLSQQDKRLRCIQDALRKASNNQLTAIHQPNAGVAAISDGFDVLQCRAAAIALDPAHRRTHCAICCGRDATFCTRCECVSVCGDCELYHSTKYGDAISECDVLRCMRQAMGQLTSTDDAEIDTTLLLAVRLLFRRYKESRQHAQQQQESLNWELFDALYAADVGSDPAIQLLLQSTQRLLQSSVQSDDNQTASQDPKPDYSWLSMNNFGAALGRIIGCGHAVVDFTRPLGDQMLGKAIFLEHSFYNHACQPNAFLSCVVGDGDGWMRARVHLMEAIDGTDVLITVSYIPMSGMDRSERQQLLQDGYGFQCNCIVCNKDCKLQLPAGHDIHTLRAIQHEWSSRLQPWAMSLRIKAVDSSNTITMDDDILHQARGMMQMLQRGVSNQGISHHHEVALELHRLLAMIDSLQHKHEDAVQHHLLFLDRVELVDPMTVATQHQACAYDYYCVGDLDKCKEQLQSAIETSRGCVGEDHPFVCNLKAEWSIAERKEEQKEQEEEQTPRKNKKQKIQ